MSNGALALGHVDEDSSYPRSGLAGIKRALDFVLALIGFVACLPLLALSAALIKLTSPGPVFYSQIRLGLGGRPFRIFKLRTMYQESEAQTGACWSTKNDPRITLIGRFLRRSHIDELPQLWNILIGDMSLIGPRPERPEMIAGLEKALPRYRQRLRIRPGLSGLAQVQLDADTDLHSVRIKLAHDLCYLEHMSLILDWRILLATCCVVCGLPFALTRTICGLPGGKAVEERYTIRAKKTVLVADLQTALESV
jgi:lipopolysaccharide/colanic/teichoic acid biosynthesis glycosyltransferase